MINVGDKILAIRTVYNSKDGIKFKKGSVFNVDKLWTNGVEYFANVSDIFGIVITAVNLKHFYSFKEKLTFSVQLYNILGENGITIKQN